MRGANATVEIITRGSDGQTPTTIWQGECFIGKPKTNTNAEKYTISQVDTYNGKMPTDVIDFEVPTTQAGKIYLDEHTEFIITNGTDQKNGHYQNLGLAYKNAPPKNRPQQPVKFSCLVIELPDS
jgi:hypothetical protein